MRAELGLGAGAGRLEVVDVVDEPARVVDEPAGLAGVDGRVVSGAIVGPAEHAARIRAVAAAAARWRAACTIPRD